MYGLLTIAAVSVGVCLAVYILIRRHYEQKMRRTYRQLLEKLDQALEGEMPEISYDESLDAAVMERLARFARAAEMSRDRARRERDSVKSLISDLSHQIRTPLANILLYAGLLQERELSGQTGKLAEKIYRQSEKLDFFMKELVRTSYLEQEMISINPETTGVREILDMACQTVELTALKKKIRIVRQETGEACYADKKWTAEALSNVLDNAIKYSAEGARVIVETISYESFVCLRVRDFGIGIREEEQGKVFERFYRSDGVRKQPGFGIGLYLVREILQRQGGYPKIESKPGTGTAVNLFLPRRERFGGGT